MFVEAFTWDFAHFLSISGSFDLLFCSVFTCRFGPERHLQNFTTFTNTNCESSMELATK